MRATVTCMKQLGYALHASLVSHIKGKKIWTQLMQTVQIKHPVFFLDVRINI